MDDGISKFLAKYENWNILGSVTNPNTQAVYIRLPLNLELPVITKNVTIPIFPVVEESYYGHNVEYDGAMWARLPITE